MLNNPVIVTSLYDIGREEWGHFNRSIETYLQYMENLLSLDSKFVIYTEKKLYESILNLRVKYDKDLSKTKIIIKEFDKTDAYQIYHQRVNQVMISDEFKKNVLHPTKPETWNTDYNICMYNKIFFIDDCVQNEYFNNDIVLWMDAGYFRDDVSKNRYHSMTFPDISKINKIDNTKATFFSFSTKFNIENAKNHNFTDDVFINGPLIVVPSVLSKSLKSSFDKTLNYCLNQGFVGNDQKMFDIMYSMNKNQFNILYANWFQGYEAFKKHTVDNYFDKVFYLNLKKDVDRNQNMIEQFDRYGIKNYERIEGTNLESVPDKSYWRNFNLEFINEKYIKGSLGCRNTHWRAIELALLRDYKRILIFEDDVIFNEDPNKILNDSIEGAEHWDMLYYGGVVEDHFRGQIVLGHAYGVSRKLIEEIYFMLPSSGMEVDNFYAKVLQQMSNNYSPTGKYIIKKMNPFNTIVQDDRHISNTK